MTAWYSGARCPGCDEDLTVDHTGKVECGGEGEGVCSATAYAYMLHGYGLERALLQWIDEEIEGKPPSPALCADIRDAHTRAWGEYSNRWTYAELADAVEVDVAVALMSHGFAPKYAVLAAGDLVDGLVNGDVAPLWHDPKYQGANRL